MDRMQLAGDWRRLVGGSLMDFVQVPGSFRPVGECILERRFDRPWPAEDAGWRYFLVTEGVLASAQFTLNGQQLGTAGAWARYRFEIPTELLRPQNTLQVAIRDLGEPFGPMPGRRWEAGLFRPIWIERRPATYIQDVIFRCDLLDDLAAATANVEVLFDGPDAPKFEVTLTDRQTGQTVASAKGVAGQPLQFQVVRPRLWSPEAPSLHILQVKTDGPRSETHQEQVGFRRIEVRGRDFYLNNRRLILKGVCRHEFTTASGYSPGDDEVRRELAMIRHYGFNYVRLVHAPCGPNVPRIAAELGLLVTQEPGTCWADLADEEIAAPAVEALRRTILRDRNVPSIFAWLIYNECSPNRDYAVRIAAMCRQLDPGRLLAMADSSNKDDQIQAMAAAADLSFYGVNVYAHRGEFLRRMQALCDRPLVITEWSGWIAQGNARTMKDFCDMFVLHSQPDEPLRIAGCSIWVWADYPEHTRPAPAAIDGWTIEGLVDAQGQAKPDLLLLSQMCLQIDYPPVRPAPKVEVLCLRPARPEPWSPVALDRLTNPSELEQTVQQRRQYPWYHNWLPPSCTYPNRPAPWPRFGRLLVDGIEFACRDEAAPACPLLLGPGRRELVIPVGRRVAGVAALGHVAIYGGYPGTVVKHWGTSEPQPAFDSLAAQYEFVFDDQTIIQPLRHGQEILRANEVLFWWTPSPMATQTRPAVRSIVNPSYEVLHLDLWERQFDTCGYLREIRWRLLDEQAILLLAGLSTWQAQ